MDDHEDLHGDERGHHPRKEIHYCTPNSNVWIPLSQIASKVCNEDVIFMYP